MLEVMFQSVSVRVLINLVENVVQILCLSLKSKRYDNHFEEFRILPRFYYSTL